MGGIDFAQLVPYERYVTVNLHKVADGRKIIRGTFREKGSKKEITEELSCFMVDHKDPFKSYQAAVSYFNFTLRDGEKERVAVRAELMKEVDSE